MTVIARDDVTLALVTDVASTAHYFQLKASTASAPTVPTVYPAPSPWVTTEPTYTEGATNSLYTVDVTVFSDGSFDYTPVSLSSSYEAAKAAYNKAQQAQSSATSAQSAATAAQTTADGKNKIFSSANEPSHTGIVPGDMWFQLDSNQNVTGIQVWNGSEFTDMVLLGNKLLVASSVGTTQIADNAITTGKISANAITALQIAAQTITGDKLDVGSVASAIITSGLFKTSDGSYGFDSTHGFWAGDTSGMHMALTGSSNGSAELAIMHGTDVISSLSFVDTISTDGYVHTRISTGQSGQFLEFATLVDSVNYQPDPLEYDVKLVAAGGTGRMFIDAQHAVNVSGTWFAHDLASLPPAPRVVGGQGTKAFAGGVEYEFDGAGGWVSQTQPNWVVCNTGINGYYQPEASGSIQALSVRKQHGIVELMGRVKAAGAVLQNSDMGAMIPDAYRPTTTTMIQTDQTGYGHLGPAFYVRPDGHIIWGPKQDNATDAVFHGMWVGA